MTRVLAVAFLLSCAPIASGSDDVIAIEVRSPRSVALFVGDTVTLVAVAITAAGDEDPAAMVYWSVLDVDSLGFVLDSATGFVTGTAQGGGRVQARVENLRSESVAITVTDTTTSPGLP